MTENYNGLVWEVSELPCGSSTPDEFVEYEHYATATDENGERIEGMAYYRGLNEFMLSLDRIEYGGGQS